MNLLSKKKCCDGCGEHRFIWKNREGKRYCQKCWSTHLAKKTVVVTPRKALPSRSPKRQREEQEYSKKRKVFLLANSMCQAHLPHICTQQATDVHHKAGRTGKLYLEEKLWLAVCRQCHMWIETHPKEARDMGLSISRTQNLNTDE